MSSKYRKTNKTSWGYMENIKKLLSLKLHSTLREQIILLHFLFLMAQML